MLNRISKKTNSAYITLYTVQITHCTFKIKIENQNLIKIKMPNPSQEPPASLKAPNEDLKDMDVLCTSKKKIESQNSAYGCIRDEWPYPNQVQDTWTTSGTYKVFKSSKCGLNGHGCSLHLQYQKGDSKFGILVYQIPVTIARFKSFLSKKIWVIIEFKNWAFSQSKLISFSEQNKSESNSRFELIWANLSQAELVPIWTFLGWS